MVLDYDRFSRDDPIGEVCLPLSELDLGAGQTLWRNLQPCKGAAVRYYFCLSVIFRRNFKSLKSSIIIRRA